jgi:hypothetical protein
MIYASTSRITSVIYSISIIARCASAYRALFFRSPRLPFIYQKRFEQMCLEEAPNANGDIYILFLFFILLLKIPYLKIEENFVLSCEALFFGIYYIKNQLFIHRTIFVQNRTIRTKVHKITFCTEYLDFVPKSTKIRTELTFYYSAVKQRQ